MPMSLNKRPCHLNAGINARGEFEGDDRVPACDFTLSGIMLDKDELGELMDDKFIHRAWFNTRGKVLEPVTRKIASFALIDKYEGSTVTLYLGTSTEKLTLQKVKLVKLRLAPQTGGLTELRLQVQCRADAEQMSQLYTHQDMGVDASMRFGKLEIKAKAQPELPIGDETDDDAGGDLVPGPLDQPSA